MLRPPVPKFRSDLSVCLRDIAEKQVPAKLKQILGISIIYESSEAHGMPHVLTIYSCTKHVCRLLHIRPCSSDPTGLLSSIASEPLNASTCEWNLTISFTCWRVSWFGSYSWKRSGLIWSIAWSDCLRSIFIGAEKQGCEKIFCEASTHRRNFRSEQKRNVEAANCEIFTFFTE